MSVSSNEWPFGYRTTLSKKMIEDFAVSLSRNMPIRPTRESTVYDWIVRPKKFRDVSFLDENVWGVT